MYSNKLCKYLWALYRDYNRDFHFHFISVGIWLFFSISACYKRYTDRNINTARNNIIHDYKFIVVLLMLYQVYMIIVLTLLFNKFRFECNTKTNIIYHSQDTCRAPHASVNVLIWPISSAFLEFRDWCLFSNCKNWWNKWIIKYQFKNNA